MHVITKLLLLFIIIRLKKKINLNALNKINYVDILPKIDLKNETIPSLKEIFNSKKLFINSRNITKEYIIFIRPVNKTEDNELKDLKKKFSKNNNTYISENFNYRKDDKYNYIKYGQICLEEKLLQPNEVINYDNPAISVIVASFNKGKNIMKSIRSIQNQSLKNIEIIIVDDCSTDDSYKSYNYLLETDSRIRIFYHLKNMGVWRTRLDGFLYSKGKYIIHFDGGDLYEDNYVLEDAYNIAEKYNLDSVKMHFRIIPNISNFDNFTLPFKLKWKSRIVNKPYVVGYNNRICGNYTNIWNRLIRSNIMTKGLYLLNTYVLNIYKNLWEDIWWNRLVNIVSDNFLIIKRYSYLYFKDGTGEGTLKIKTEDDKDRVIHEFIHFLYFNLAILRKRSNKENIINLLKMYNESKDVNINDFKSKFYILDNLLELLLKDRFVSIKDKFFLKKLLKESKKRKINLVNRKSLNFIRY